MCSRAEMVSPVLNDDFLSCINLYNSQKEKKTIQQPFNIGTLRNPSVPQPISTAQGIILTDLAYWHTPPQLD